MRLVPDWRKALRWFSVQILLVIATIPVVWPMIPPEVQAWLPEAWRPWVVFLLAVGGIAGRLIDQKKEPPQP